MTITQLRKQIKNLPGTAEVLFALWGLEGDKHTLFQMKAGNSQLNETETGGIAVIVGSADNCRAHKMIRKGKKLHY